MTATLQQTLDKLTAPAANALCQTLDDKTVQCNACAHRCKIKPDARGICRMRTNRNGTLYRPNGYVAGLAIDPIEKKPFYHVLPDQSALSFGMLGCNFHCDFCQNWQSSQTLRDNNAFARPDPCTPEHIVNLARKHNTPAIVSTYNEPLITADWAHTIFELAAKHKILCGLVSNGHATHQVIDYLKPHTKLFNIDLKAYNPASYKKLGGNLDAVLDTIAYAHTAGYWVEVVTLVVPDFNDSDAELADIAKFIASVSPDIPWHCTAYHPNYHHTAPPRTPAAILARAHNHGKDAGLNFVYAGNLPGQVGQSENTRCPNCQTTLIQRQGFTVTANNLKNNQCPNCHQTIPGIWQ